MKTRKSAKHQSQVAILKKNCQLFSQLYIACQVRDGNLDEFFSHGNHTFPPSLSKDGMFHAGNKSGLLSYLDDIQDTSQDKPSIECIVIDGPAVVIILPPVNCTTLKDYSKKVFLPFILQQFQSGCWRVDNVWDVYLENSLKEYYKCITRLKNSKQLACIFSCWSKQNWIIQISCSWIKSISNEQIGDSNSREICSI